MPDVTDQLAAYAGWVGDQAAPVEPIEARSLALGDPSELVLDPAWNRHRRRSVWPILAAAAVVGIVVGSAGLFLATRDDDAADVVTEPTPPPLTTPTDGSREHLSGPPPDPNSPSYGYLPGWHELDPGPLEPRKGAATVWTGNEIIVVGGTSHVDGAAYTPLTGRWRRIFDPPFDPGPATTTHAVAAGMDVIVVRSTIGQESDSGREAAVYRPGNLDWRSLPAPPPPTQGPSGAMVWTGSEVILVDAPAAFDPVTEVWRPITLDSPGPGAAVVWTGDVLVLASPGAPTVAYDPVSDSTTLMDAPPAREIDMTGGHVGAVAAHGGVVIVDEAGRASRLDLATGRWDAEAIVPVPAPCQPEGHALDDGRSAWDLCGELWIRSFHGEWSSAGTTETRCCPRGTVGTGSVLLAWVSNDDAANDPGAPVARLVMWVPPDMPAPRVRLDDGTYEGFVRGIDLDGIEPVVTIELVDHFFGEDAEREARVDGVTGYPNEWDMPYYMRARGLPPVALAAAPDADLHALNLSDEDLPGGERVVGWEEFAEPYNHPRSSSGGVMWLPVQIEVVGGIVVAVRQFYTP